MLKVYDFTYNEWGIFGKILCIPSIFQRVIIHVLGTLVDRI